MPALAKTTSYVYKGDEEAARKLLGLANLQLMKLRNLMAFNNLEQYALTVYNKVGAYIKVSSIFGNEVAEVFYPKIKGVPEEVLKRKRIMRMKVAQDWTILYAPIPPPDPQDWGGWMESGKTDLNVDNFLNIFGLVSWGWPVWSSFTITGSVLTNTTPGTLSVQDGGWWLYSAGHQPGFPTTTYMGPVWQAIGISRKISHRTDQNFTYTFFADLIPAIAIHNWSESGQKCWTSNGGYFEQEGYVYIPSNPYGAESPPTITLADAREPAGSDPGFSRAEGTGYISWQDPYLLGFWKQEWTVYNPSSLLDNNNYVLFYDKYVWNNSHATSSLPAVGFFPCIIDVYGAIYTYSSYSSQMKSEYVSVIGSGSGNHVSFPYYYTDPKLSTYTYRMWVTDPDAGEFGDNSTGTITYETHMCGKYEGEWFDEVVGSATWYGSGNWGTNGSWSGNNIFPWMGRMYDKSSLKEGTENNPDKTSDHNLLLASWLVGAAAGHPTSTDKVPGCEGITQVVYRMRHGATVITKTYSASHPGWHTVWTDPDGRLWRAYGDIFAALKGTSIKEIELGPPEWIDWWYADGSQFIVEEDDN